MKVYLDDKELNDNYSKFTLPQILDDIKSKLNKQIIRGIYMNDVKINKRYLKDSLVSKEDIDEIKFITQNTDDLIKETLEEIDSYLPRLKNGCLNTANFFRNGEFKKANNKLQLILDGINWYIESTNNIVNLLKNKDLKNEVKDNLILLNNFLEELYEAQENEDNILIADILEFEIVEFINEFIFLNKKIFIFLQNS